MANRDKALLLFSRLPIGRETKTRLSPLLNEAEREELHRAFWADVFETVLEFQVCADIFLYWTGGGKIEDYAALIPPSFRLREQRGSGLGERMSQAMGEAFNAGYKRVLLMGVDAPAVGPDDLLRAFEALNRADAVLGPSLDGGYWLIGMRKFVPDVFEVPAWGGADVLRATLRCLDKKGLAYALAGALLDIDTPKDAREFLSRPASYGRHTRTYLQRVIHN